MRFSRGLCTDDSRAATLQDKGHDTVFGTHRLYCGYCGRRMQGQYSNQAPYYRCRYPREYALASHGRHPGNVYLREAEVLPAIDRLLLIIFAPHRLEQTIREMQAAQDPGQAPSGSPGLAKTPGRSSPAVTPGSPATRPPSTPEPTPRPSPNGPARSKPSAPLYSPAPPARPLARPLARSPRTTSGPSSPAWVTCATSSATPSHR